MDGQCDGDLTNNTGFRHTHSAFRLMVKLMCGAYIFVFSFKKMAENNFVRVAQTQISHIRNTHIYTQ